MFAMATQNAIGRKSKRTTDPLTSLVFVCLFLTGPFSEWFTHQILHASVEAEQPGVLDADFSGCLIDGEDVGRWARGDRLVHQISLQIKQERSA